LFVRGTPRPAETDVWAGTNTPRNRVFEAYAGVGSSQRKLLAELHAYSESEPWIADDCRDMAHWVSLNLGVTYYRAERWLFAARELEKLPRLSMALENGTLNLDKVVELCRFATPDEELKLIEWARRKSVTAIKERGDELQRISLEESSTSGRAGSSSGGG
jgi:hypothetical protein